MKQKVVGLTLLELLVAIAIVAMSLTLLYRVLGGIARTTSRLQQQQFSALVATSILRSKDHVGGEGWNDSGSDGPVSWRVQSFPHPDPLLTGASPPLQLHRVVITLTHSEQSGPPWVIETLLPQVQPRPTPQGVLP